MTDVPDSYAPRMARVLGAVGVSSAIGLALAAVRMKLVAVELGPSGVGAVALLASFLVLVTTLFHAGVGSSAIREIAAGSAPGERDAVRRALRRVTRIFAVIAGLLVLVAAEPLAESALGDGGLADELRWCALAAVAGVLSEGAIAELNAARRLRSLALVPAFSGVLATLAVAVVYVLGHDLVVTVVLAPAVTALAVAEWFRRRLPVPTVDPGSSVLPHARRLLSLGGVLVLNTASLALAALVVRILVDDELGRRATGEYQAALAVAGAYSGFFLAALWTDYLPLLSELSGDRRAMNRAVDTQLQVATLAFVPGLMVLIVAAPLVVALLYSDAFADTPSLVRYVVLGELLRLAAWTTGYVLLARRARVLYVAVEVLYAVAVIGLTAAVLPAHGLKGAAIAYAVCQAAKLAWTLAFVWRTSGYTMSRTARLRFAGAVAAGGLVLAASETAGPVAWSAAALCGTLASVLAVRELARVLGVRLGELRRSGVLKLRAAARNGRP
jgi:PST family polysaccharide transporter